MGIYRRGGKLWMVFRNSAGRRVYASTGLGVGDEKRAQEMLDVAQRHIKPSKGVTVAAYADTWAARRTASGMSNANVDRGRIIKHVPPAILATGLAAVTRDDVNSIMAAVTKTCAPKTAWNIWGALRRLFADAVEDGLLTETPCKLRRGLLPAKVDADPEWRPTAVYTREELHTLCFDQRIPLRRRVSHALQFLAGLRYGEVAGLQWRHWSASQQPLGCLLVAGSWDTRNKKRKSTKTKTVRQVPVHPALAALLTEWRAATPWSGPDAPIFSHPETGGITPNHHGWKWWQRDLAMLGFRHRRQHDARRTFISLAIADGARSDHLKWVTHGGNRASIMDVYTTLPWATLCAAVMALRCDSPVTVPPVTTVEVLPGAGLEDARVLPFRKRSTGSARPDAEPLGSVAQRSAGASADCHSLLQPLRAAEQSARAGDTAGVVAALRAAAERRGG